MTRLAIRMALINRKRHVDVSGMRFVVFFFIYVTVRIPCFVAFRSVCGGDEWIATFCAEEMELVIGAFA